MTYMVYWTDTKITNEFSSHGIPQSQSFDSTQLSQVLKFMEMLRNDASNRFVTMCSEHPDSVGQPGISEVGPDYNWTKRRDNERPVTRV